MRNRPAIQSRLQAIGARSWGQFSPDFVRDLADRLDGHRVLEVFAGNGLLSALLKEQGINVRATSILSGQDGHEHGLLHEVEEISATAAVERYGADSDILLMSWPPATEAAAEAVIAWSTDRPIIFIGEITRPELGFSGLGGCASDRLFAITEVMSEFGSYRGRGSLDRAVELRLDPHLLSQFGARGFSY